MYECYFKVYGRRKKFGNTSHIAAGIRSKVNSEGEFMARGRIEDVTYDESSSESDTQSESDESNSEGSGDSDSEEYSSED